MIFHGCKWTSRTYVFATTSLILPTSLHGWQKVSYVVWSEFVREIWVALKKGTAFRAAPLGRSGRLPLSLTFKRTSVCTPITMTEFRRYYRADRLPIPSKVGPAALIRPIPITWCERIFVYGLRALFQSVSYNIWPLLCKKTHNALPPVNNNWP